MLIRQEKVSDYEAVYALIEEAFASAEHADGNEQAVSYYQFTLVNYIGFHDKGMLLAGGCGDTNGRPGIGETEYLEKAYRFGKEIYPESK